MQITKPQNNLLSSLFSSENTLAVLTNQSNNLTKLTGEACFIANKLKKVLIVCDSELLVNAFTLIIKGINPHVATTCFDIATFFKFQHSHQGYDAVLTIVHDTNSLRRIITNCKDITPKLFLIAPSSFQLPPLSETGIDIAISLESSASDIRNAFLRGIEGERFCLGFSCVIEEKFSHLTPRQKDVLKLICNGKSNKEIARDLNIALSTIKVHCAAIFKELGVANRTQAALILGS